MRQCVMGHRGTEGNARKVDLWVVEDKYYEIWWIL